MTKKLVFTNSTGTGTVHLEPPRKKVTFASSFMLEKNQLPVRRLGLRENLSLKFFFVTFFLPLMMMCG